MVCLIVGDSPSKLNDNPDKVFVGAKCEKRLNAWIKELGIVCPIMVNQSSDTEFTNLFRMFIATGAPILALGINAQKACKKQSYSLFKKNFVPYHGMPHPSSRNRLLNSREYEIESLEKTKHYLINYKNSLAIRTLGVLAPKESQK